MSTTLARRRAPAPLALALLGCLAAPAVAQPAGREWKTTRTAHVTVVGDAEAADLQRLGRDVERFRDAFTMLSPAIRLDDSAPTYVVVFRDDASMRPYKPRYRGQPVDSADAFFVAAPEASYVVLTATDAAPAGPGRPPQPRGAQPRGGHQNAWRGYASELVRDAAATLAEVASHQRPGDWVSTIVAFLRGELTAEAFIDKADDDGQRTEAHAYAGIKASIDGNRDAARTHLEWVRTRGRTDFIEYGYALGELRRLARAQAL